MKRLFILCIVICTFKENVFPQENHFSQFYNSPQYINPAFAGDTYYMRTGGATRIMNPLPSTPIINSYLYLDHKLINQHGGLGITLHSLTEKLNHTKLQVNYSYTLQLNKTSWIKGGIGISLNQRNANTYKFTFPDQYDILGYTGNATAEPSLKENSFFPGLAAGIIFYDEMLWISFSGDYLNLPTEKFAGQKNNYPLKFNASAGFLYPINKNKSSKRRFSRFGGLEPYSSLGPVISYTQQNKYAEISAGLSANIQPFYGGIQYRHQHDFRIDKSEYAYNGLVVIAGYRQEEFSVAYSYDYSLSSYTVNRNGAHELSFVWYFFRSKEDYKKNALVPLASQLLY